MENTEDLSGFVRRTMNEKNLSTYDVQKASGNKITAATVTKILNREIKSNGVNTLASLAAGLSVPADIVFNIARGLPATPTRFEIYADRFDAHDLTETQWQFLETLFNDQVTRFKADLIARHKFIMAAAEPSLLAPVVATITGKKIPDEMTHDDVQRMFDKDAVPRKRKAS